MRNGALHHQGISEVDRGSKAMVVMSRTRVCTRTHSNTFTHVHTLVQAGQGGLHRRHAA